MTTIGAVRGKGYLQETATESAGTGDPFHYQRLLDDWSGDAFLLQELLETFSRESALDLAALETAFETRDAPGVARLAHRIKGSAALMGASQVREQAAILEGYVQRRELDHALMCLRTLRAELKRCHDFVASVRCGR